MAFIDDEELVQPIPAKNRKAKNAKKAKIDPKDTLLGMIEEDKKNDTLNTLHRLVSMCERVMQDRVFTWDRYRRKYRRGLYYMNNLSGTPIFTVNYTYATVESVKAQVRRNLPPQNVTPKGTLDDYAAEVMTQVLNEALKESGYREAVKEVVHHGLISTLGFMKVHYDPDAEKNVVEAMPPESLLVDPGAKSLYTARFMTHRRRDVSVEEIFDTFGTVPEEDSGENVTDGFGKSHEGSYLSDAEAYNPGDVTKCYDVNETWIRSYADGRENDWYVITWAGNTILDEKYSPYAHNQHPFVSYICNEDFNGDNIYLRGTGIVEEMESMQDRADYLDLRISKHISLLTNRQRFISAQSGLNPNTMDNTAGRTYTVNGIPSNCVWYDAPPQLPLEVYNYRDRTESLMQTVTGVYDVTQGRRPVGITAGRAMESLKDAAETRYYMVIDDLGTDTLKRVGQLVMQNCLQFYDDMKIIHATDGQTSDGLLIIEDYPDELQPQPVQKMDENGEPMFDENGEPVPDDAEDAEEPEVDTELQKMREQFKKENDIALVLSDVSYEWDIEVQTDSAMPTARAERAQIASEMFRIGAIDREAMLDAVDYPKRKQILKRMEGSVSGKNAGDPQAEAGQGAMEQMMAQFAQVLQQMGLPPEQIQAMMEQMMQGGAGGEMMPPQQPAEGGNFPPQITQ